MRQSAVEWYAEKFAEHLEEVYGYKITSLTLLAKAKEMEKQQIIDARVDSPLLIKSSKYDYIIEAEQYYNETFNK